MMYTDDASGCSESIKCRVFNYDQVKSSIFKLTVRGEFAGLNAPDSPVGLGHPVLVL